MAEIYFGNISDKQIANHAEVYFEPSVLDPRPYLTRAKRRTPPPIVEETILIDRVRPLPYNNGLVDLDGDNHLDEYLGTLDIHYEYVVKRFARADYTKTVHRKKVTLYWAYDPSFSNGILGPKVRFFDSQGRFIDPDHFSSDPISVTSARNAVDNIIASATNRRVVSPTEAIFRGAIPNDYCFVHSFQYLCGTEVGKSFNLVDRIRKNYLGTNTPLSN